jgi:hypothetical protein
MKNPLVSGGRSSASASTEDTAVSAMAQSPACPRCGGEHHEYVTIADIRRLLHVSHTKAWELVVADGEIRHVRIGEKTIRVRRGDLCAYIEAREAGRAW